MPSIKKIFLLVLLAHPISGSTQDSIKTNSTTHIFWQPDKSLKANDFQGDSDSNSKLKNYCDSINMCTVASVGVFAVLDVPKRKKDRGKKLEKVYFAPAFEIETSVFYQKDSIGINKQQVVFDIYELSARVARRNLKLIEDSIGIAYGTRYIFFKTIEAEAKELRDNMVYGFTRDVYILKKEGALEEWKNMVNEQLEYLNDFTTTPEECYRFIENEPIEKGYIKSKTVTGNLRN